MDLKQASLLELVGEIEDEGFGNFAGQLSNFLPWQELIVRCKNLEILLDSLLESPNDLEAALDNYENERIK